MFDAAPERSERLYDADAASVRIDPMQRGPCAVFVRPDDARKILLVGAERRDEFAHALKLMSLGHHVIATNPRETTAAKAFRRAGGRFVRARIEELLSDSSRFHLIFENYPYPSGKNYVPAKPFAFARLARLAPGGHWTLYTESGRLASLLKGVVDQDSRLTRRFEAKLTRIPFEAAPPSDYPPTDVRFRLIFRRLF